MRVGQRRAVRRVLFAAAVVVSAAFPLATLAAGAALAADPLAEAKQRADEARREANDAASRYTNAESSFEDLGNQIVDIEQKIAAGEARREELRGIARDAGKTLVELSLQWLLSRPQVDSVILGASRPEQLDENLKACEGGPLDDAVAARCDDVWKRLRGVTPKYNR